MTQDEHRERHMMLHGYLDELIADFFQHTGKLFREATISELMHWSHEQTIEPTEAKV